MDSLAILFRMKALVLTALFVVSNFLLAANLQLEGGKTNLAWVSAKANISTTGSFNPNYKISVSPDKVLLTYQEHLAPTIFKTINSFTFTAPIYILNCSYLI